MTIKMNLPLLFLLLASSLLAQKVDIIDLHQNDDNGEPAAPYAAGSRVTVEGVITAGASVFSRSYLDVFIQDKSGGINIYDPGTDLFHLQTGDYVRVSGNIKQYRGLTEIVNPTVYVLQKDSALPKPLMLTCKQLANSYQSDHSEPNESRLVRINSVRITRADHPEYTISDQSGEAKLYIREDTGLRPPVGEFDVIGIVKQYDRSRPYTSGYEIIPRFKSDFVSAGIAYLHPPILTEITPHTVEISWQTDIAAASRLRWGQTPALEMVALGDSLQVTDHKVRLNGLLPATLYYVQAVSVGDNGGALSDTLQIITPSTESSGTIVPYFTKSIKPELADPHVANGYTDLAQILIQKLNNADFSIDACFYSLTHESIANALIQAHQRGVEVRFIYENENENDLIRSLPKVHGIAAIADDFGSNDGSGLMHNKFVIIDHRDKSLKTDDLLCTGSANASYNGSKRNIENMLCIQDETLCAVYTLEFNEMWGSDNMAPDIGQSRFGDRKTDNTPHHLKIGDCRIETYMSPSDQTERHIIKSMKRAEKSIYFAIYTFTSDGIAALMRQKYHNATDFWLRGVFDYESADYGVYKNMHGSGNSAWQPAADVHLDRSAFLMHHKYMILDGWIEDSDPIVITGSHNWTYSADHLNDENTLIIHSYHIANLYLQEFASLYDVSGGSKPITSGVEPFSARFDQPERAASLLPNYPNPFNSSTVIPIHTQKPLHHAKLIITDTCGRQVLCQRLDSDSNTGIRVDMGELNISSGLYFATMRGQRSSNSIKLLYIK